MVTRSTIAKSVMQNFLDIMKDNITKVTIWNPSEQKMVDHNIQRYSSTYSDAMLKTKSNYPVVIVYKPELPERELSFRQIQTNGSITIGIHTTNSLVTTEFYDQMREIIITNKLALASDGLSEIKFTEDDEDAEKRSGFKDHWANFTLSFSYEYTDGY